MRHQDALRSTLKQLLLQRNVKTVKQLIALHQVPGQFHSKHNIFPFFYILHLILLQECLIVSKDLRVEQSFEDLETTFEEGEKFSFVVVLKLQK